MNDDVRGHKALWAAVILQAFRDLDARYDANGGNPIEHRNSSWDWLNSHPHFEWICEVLEIDPHKLRISALSRDSIKNILKTKLAGYRLGDK